MSNKMGKIKKELNKIKIKNKTSCLESEFKRKSLLIQNTRAQHEIVGFILIVVIVAVIGLFLLVFYLRKEPVRHESLDLQNFLQSSMLYTTHCAISFEPQYDSLQDLIRSCYKNQKCLNDKMACLVLNETLADLIKESWMVSEDRPVNAFSLLIYYSEKDVEEQKDEILSLQENWGNCTGSKTGAENLIHHYPGNIAVSMEICYT